MFPLKSSAHNNLLIILSCASVNTLCLTLTVLVFSQLMFNFNATEKQGQLFVHLNTNSAIYH